jgi:diaminohydroxyphosphoribosylaminopyrimidine deaminase/5-amino-6-(5-phosphoribosylamino)uracil reductase
VTLKVGETIMPRGVPSAVAAGRAELGQVLYPDGAPADQGADEIFRPFLGACADRPFVVAQLGQSLDGRIATLSGDSKYINGQHALIHLHRIRANVDAVVVGVGTVIADDPLLTVRLVSGRNPVRVVIDPRGRVPATARCLVDGAVRTLILRGEGAGGPVPSGCERVDLPLGADGRLHPAAMIGALAARGLCRILVEGGAQTVSTFIDAGLIDRLHVLVAPVILGSGKPGLELAPIEKLHGARRPATRVRLFEDGNVLFDCDLRCPEEELRRREGSPSERELVTTAD